MKQGLLWIGVMMGWVTSQLQAQTWQYVPVGYGTKPRMVLNAQNNPRITYVFENGSNGYLAYAQPKPGLTGFDTTVVKTGYFFGPAFLDLDANEYPHIIYHDHNLFGGDLAYDTWSAPYTWVHDGLNDPGHDGWESSIVLDASGHPHITFIDFYNTLIQYAYHDGGQWAIDTIANDLGNVPNCTSLVLDAQGEPQMVYFSTNYDNLIYAHRVAGEWVIDTVEDGSQALLGASLLLDEQQRPQVSYARLYNSDTAYIEFAYWKNNLWNYERVDTLYDMSYHSYLNTSLVKPYLDQNRMMYCDHQVLKLAVRDSATHTWSVQTLKDLSATGHTLGQHVDFKMDANGEMHMVYTELFDGNHGQVWFGTTNSLLSLERVARNQLLSVFPNPAKKNIRIHADIQLTGKLSIYQTCGQLIHESTCSGGEMVSLEMLNSGLYQLRWETSAGVYSGKLVVE